MCARSTNDAMEFEWDEAKARSNLTKHGIDFADATAVFEDDYVLFDAG